MNIVKLALHEMGHARKRVSLINLIAHVIEKEPEKGENTLFCHYKKFKLR